VSDAGGGCFVDERARAESAKSKRLGERVRLVRHKVMRQNPSANRNRLESPGAPAAIHIQAWHRSLADDWTRIRNHIDNARPVT